MYAINEGMVKVNGVAVETFEREVEGNLTALQVSAGTTGYKGSGTRDAGGRTYLRLTCLCGDLYFRPVKNDEGTFTGIEIAASGDDGLDAIMKALDFMQKTLDDQRCDVRD